MKSRHNLVKVAPVLVALAAACGSEPSEAVSDAQESPFAEGSKEARAAVAFVNDPATDSGRLKKAGVTAASTRTAVFGHRDGANGSAGGGDDDSFDSLGELDGIKGIGPATLIKIAAYARARGYGDESGSYHGVYFTENQADRILDLANQASITELDATTSVDARALKNIGAARPITSMTELASLSRVKSTALRLLRDRADVDFGAPTCGEGSPCPTGLWCTGGSSQPGRCVDTGVDGSGDPCAADEGICGADLVCAGRSDDFDGICVPTWMRDEFASEITATIPDGPSGSVGVSVEVVGLASVPMDAVLTTAIEHPRPEDLELTLINPFETETVVWPAGSGPIPQTLVVGVPGDESANGLWTLRVADKQSGEQGTISLFALRLTTRFD